MKALTPASAAVLGLVLVASTFADPPRITNISPIGARRGEATAVDIAGTDLAANPQLVAPFPASVEKEANSDGGHFRMKLLVSPEAAVGVYTVRVKTDDGLSNPFLLAVGQVPQVGEKEDNSVFETAQPVPSPVVVEGQLAGADVDFFRFPGKKGQRIVVDAQCARVGSGVDPQIRLTTAGRKFVESADDSPGLLTDARLTAVLPEDGDYVVEISDSKYQGAGRPIYRLVIGPIPVATEVYPLGGRRGETVGLEFRGGTLPDLRVGASTIAVPPLTDLFRPRVSNVALGLPGEPLDVEIAAPLDVLDLPELREPTDPSAPPIKAVAPVVFNGRIDPPGDEDRFALAVSPGQALRIRVDAAELGSGLDGTLTILGPAGNGLANAEDTVVTPAVTKDGKKTPGILSPDPSLDFTVPQGVNEITLSLRDLIGRGGVGFPYRLIVEPITPSFVLALNDDHLNIPKGGNAAIGVSVQRKAYNGPIVLGIAEPPPGLTVRSTTIPEGQNAGIFTVSASADATFGAVDLKVTGTGQGPSGPIVTVGTKMLVFAQQANIPTNSSDQVGLAASVALAIPAVLETPPGPVEVVHGLGGPIPVKVARGPEGDSALAFAALAPPTGMPLPPNVKVSGALPEKAAEGAATLEYPAESPLAPFFLVFTAKGKLGPKEQTIVSPVVTVQVVRPATIESAAPMVEVKSGASVELKGKVVRKGAFKEPVKLTLNGLPAGLKSEPITVAPDAADFTLKIEANGDAPAAMAGAQLAVAFQVNKKDYPTPPVGVAVKVVK